MIVYYNNKKLEVEDGVTVYQVVEQVEVVEHKAVWLNGKHLVLDAFDTIVKPNDHIKVVRIRGGG